MDIKLGTQLCVDQAYKCLIPDTRYYYLGPWNQTHATLLFFFENGEYWRIATIQLERREFEALISPGAPVLRCCEVQLRRPTWMASCESTNFAEIELKRRDTKVQEHKHRIAATLERLGAALLDQKSILATANPARTLNTYATAANVHPYRFASHFFCYILHGKDPWVLMPRWFGNGKWDREVKGKKYGRSALARDYCFNFPLTSDMRIRIKLYASKSKEKYRTFVDFYDELIRKEFGCNVIELESGRRVFHTQNWPFPSPNQAYRTVINDLTTEEYAVLFGKQKRIRPNRLFNLGNFTEPFACNLEAIESDGYFINEVLRSFISERPTTKMVVVRTICCTTSCSVGVGFSIGGERREAYRAALYSMVAPREYLEKIYGLDEGSLKRWVTGGMAASSTTDRGSAGWNLVAEDLDQRFPLQTIAPSKQPRSRALNESSHPRTPDASLDDIYLKSDLTVAGVIKRELLRAAADNESSSIVDRLSDSIQAEMLALDLPATPNGFWEYNCRKGRNAGDADMSHEEAIRTFWEPITVKLCRDGVNHNDSFYGSEFLRESGVMEMLGTAQQSDLRAYALSCAVGFLHVEVNGKLIEVERVHRLRQHQEDYSQTKEDLDEAKRNRAQHRSEQRMAATAARVAYNQQAVDQTGEPLNGGRTRHGRKPGGRKAAASEIAAIRAHTRSHVS